MFLIIDWLVGWWLRWYSDFLLVSVTMPTTHYRFFLIPTSSIIPWCFLFYRERWGLSNHWWGVYWFLHLIFCPSSSSSTLHIKEMSKRKQIEWSESQWGGFTFYFHFFRFPFTDWLAAVVVLFFCFLVARGYPYCYASCPFLFVFPTMSSSSSFKYFTLRATYGAERGAHFHRVAKPIVYTHIHILHSSQSVS